MDDARRSDSPAAILIFAESQQRDRRRRALPVAASPLLSLPDLRSLAGRAEVHWFTDRPAHAAPAPHLRVHRQRGRGFAQRLENAVDDLAAMGYRRVVIVGRDCPQLSAADVAEALAQLESGKRLVVGPDHRGGCWLIAVHAADRALLSGVRWQHDTDAGELLSRVAPAQAVVLDTRFDLDDLADLRLLARHFLPATRVMGLLSVGPHAAPILTAADLHLRVAHQLPPPRVAACRRRCA